MPRRVMPLVVRRVDAYVATWTGRCALSRVTETPLSRFVTSGARCTRTSALRSTGARVRRRSRHAAARTSPLAQRRREPQPQT